MQREIIEPKSKEDWLEMRTHDITSTESAALFGLSPYVSLYELWHRKSDPTQIEFNESEPMRWGLRFEEAIAKGIAEDFDLGDIRPMKEFIRLPKLRLGSSFDYAIGDKGILEIKNVGFFAYKRGWLVDNGEVIEAPLHIEMQVQHQLFVSGREFAIIGACIGGDQGVVIHRKRDERIFDQLTKKAEKFWKSIDEKQEPSPDFQKDADFLTKMFSHAEPGTIYEASPTSEINKYVEAYGEVSNSIKELSLRKDGLKAKMLTIIQDAEKAKGDNWTISAGLVGPKHMEFERKGFRNFRISWRKK